MGAFKNHLIDNSISTDYKLVSTKLHRINKDRLVLETTIISVSGGVTWTTVSR